MFTLQKRRKGFGQRKWHEVDQNEDRAPLDAEAYTNNKTDVVFEWAVFEQLDSPAPPPEE